MVILSHTAVKQPVSQVSWQREWRESIVDARILLNLLNLSAYSDQLSENPRFPMRVSRSYVSRMRIGDIHDPLLRQVLPLVDEILTAPGFSLDAVGDLGALQVSGVLQKYQGRALFITTGSCAIHCRYCFRQHYAYQDAHASRQQWRQALDYVHGKTDVHEVILSGGDPWSLATSKLQYLTDALQQIPHVRRLRIHTRLPVVLPSRVDASLVTWLQGIGIPVVVVIHANHAQEINDEVACALGRLRDTGVFLLNQTVMLKGVNDHIDALSALSERLFEVHVLPYYLHLLDRVAGTAHFEVPEREALELYRAMQARMPGYLVPRLVREIAGEASKTLII